MDDFTSFSRNSTTNEGKHSSYRTQQSLMVFCLLLNVLGNIILTFVLIKLKNSKEIDFPDMKQHFTFLSIVYSLFNVLGSFLVYPLWFNIYHGGASNGELPRKISTSKCRLAVLFTSFTVSTNILLHVALSVDRCVNWVFPFHYLLYKRKKHSRIPMTVVFCSTCLAATWSVIAAYIPGKVTKVQRNSGFLCILNVTPKSPAVSFGLALGYLCLLTLGLAVTLLLVSFFKTKSERKLVRKHRGGGKLLPRLPIGMPLFLAFTITGLLFWTPFLTSIQIMPVIRGFHEQFVGVEKSINTVFLYLNPRGIWRVCLPVSVVFQIPQVTATVAQFYSVGQKMFLGMLSLLFIPPVIHPFVTYVIFYDAREKFHELLDSAWTSIKLRLKS